MMVPPGGVAVEPAHNAPLLPALSGAAAPTAGGLFLPPAARLPESSPRRPQLVGAILLYTSVNTSLNELLGCGTHSLCIFVQLRHFPRDPRSVCRRSLSPSGDRRQRRWRACAVVRACVVWREGKRGRKTGDVIAGLYRAIFRQFHQQSLGGGGVEGSNMATCIRTEGEKTGTETRSAPLH